MRKNYQWWREYATSAENRAVDGQGDAVPDVPDVPDSVHAQQRAAAAAMIAEEANAARMKALLDAAREQADHNTILSAEKRYNEARDDYESARDAMSAQEKQQDTGGDTRETPLAVDIADAVNRVLKRVSPQQKAISLGVVVALLLGVGVGTGGYFMWNAPQEGLSAAAPDRIALTPKPPVEPAAPVRQDTVLADRTASPESPPAANDLPTKPVILPASANSAVVLPGQPAIASKPAVAPQKPKRVYSITLPAASAKLDTEAKEQTARRSTPEPEIQVNTRPRGVLRAPTTPPAPNPRVVVRDLQVVPPPPPKPPVQIEEAE